MKTTQRYGVFGSKDGRTREGGGQTRTTLVFQSMFAEEHRTTALSCLGTKRRVFIYIAMVNFEHTACAYCTTFVRGRMFFGMPPPPGSASEPWVEPGSGIPFFFRFFYCVPFSPTILFLLGMSNELRFLWDPIARPAVVNMPVTYTDLPENMSDRSAERRI